MKSLTSFNSVLLAPDSSMLNPALTKLLRNLLYILIVRKEIDCSFYKLLTRSADPDGSLPNPTILLQVSIYSVFNYRLSSSQPALPY